MAQNSIDLAEATDLFLMSSPYSPKTKRNFGVFLRNTLTSYFAPARPLSEITHGDLVRFIAYCETKRGVSRSSLRQYSSFLRAFFKWGAASGYLEVDPAKSLTSPKVVNKERVKGVPLDHLRCLLDYTEQTSKRNYSLLLFLAVTGCRVGAASHLLRSNIDFRRKQVRVFEKGQRWVVYEFDEMTAVALDKWLAIRPETDHDYVWTSQRKSNPRLKESSIRRMLVLLCERLEIPSYSPHQFRHSVGEILASHDHSELSVASALNHRSLRSVRHYMPERLSETRHLRREIEATLYPDRVGDDEDSDDPGVSYLRIVK